MENSYSFTPREKDVIELLLKGRSNNQIAQALSISTSTVEFHLRNVYGKLGVNSRTEAVLVLAEYNLGKSIGDFSKKLTESVVDNGITDADNHGQTKSRSRSMPMKYIVSGLFAILILAVLFVYSQSRNVARPSIAVTNSAPPSIVVSASATPNIESCSLIHDVKFCVEGMAFTDDVTYVMLEIRVPPTIQPDMMGFMLPSALDSEISPTLKDNLGNEYRVADDMSLMVFPGSDQQTYQQTLKFPPVSKEAKSATLSFPAIVTSSAVEASILLDLGESPQPGDVIPLDQTLDLQGQEIRLTKAELSGDGINSLHVDIMSDPVELKDEIVGLMLSLGIPEGTNMGTGFGSKMILPDVPYHAFAELTRPGMPPVSGMIRIPIHRINLYYEGSFEIPFAILAPGLYSEITPTLDQSAQMAEIRRFANDPDLDVTFITFEYINNTLWCALYFTKDEGKYWVDTQTRGVVQFENSVPTEPITNNKSADEIRSTAEQFAFANSSKFNKLYDNLVFSEKTEENLLVFRWEYLTATNSEAEPPFVQVVITPNGRVIRFTNTLDYFEP